MINPTVTFPYILGDAQFILPIYYLFFNIAFYLIPIQNPSQNTYLQK